MNKSIPQSEYTKTNSIYSAMRLAFLKVVKFWIISSACIIFAIVGTAVANAFLPQGKVINLPVGALIGAIVSIGGVSFTGKAIQSFAEPDAPEIDTMRPIPSKEDPNMIMAEEVMKREQISK